MDLLRLVTGRDNRQDERQFLPAALEVIETPPSPTGRAMGLLIVLFFSVAVAWSFLGRVDELATAPGRVLPAGEVKVIQPLDPGIVRAIRVQDGDHVAAGQVLIELDPTQTSADSERASEDLTQAQLDVARLTALKIAAETGGAPHFVAPAGAASDRVEEAQAGMQAQYDQQASKIADLTQQITEKDAEAAEVGTERAKITAELPMLENKEQIHRQLTEQGYGTSLAYLDAQQQVIEARHELDAQVQRGSQAEAGKLALERQRDGARSEYVANVFSDLRKAQEQVSELSQELIKAKDKSAETELRSPISGVVDQMAVHTLNGVVTPAEHLMIVVPDNQNLMVEAQLANRDVGFVHVGQSVKVKVETFNFTRYGLLEGQVVGVSHDVIVPDERQTPSDPTSSPLGRQSAPPTYVARIALSTTSMMIDGRREDLRPGMSVTAEIKTGDRTIIDYLLSPLKRRTQESMHER